jgi:hypothetical protein
MDFPKISIFPRPPNLKTSSTPSRTQLKLQLQRDQLLQESERREIENQQQKSSSEEASKVEMQSIGLDVPPQILQVGSNLKMI